MVRLNAFLYLYPLVLDHDSRVGITMLEIIPHERFWPKIPH